MKIGLHSARIPERPLFYPVEARRRWRSMWKRWLASGRTEVGVWSEYKALLQTPGFQFMTWTTSGRFGEAFAALDLQRRGYECFHACALFRYGKRLVTSLEGTKLVEKRLAASALPLPRTLAGLIDPRPRNPDLAAYHARRRHWLFCEVKLGHGDRVKREQLVALAVLRDLLGATVEVVRVLPEEERGLREPKVHSCSYTVTRQPGTAGR